jgi:ABC-2 type transport system permease protein
MKQELILLLKQRSILLLLLLNLLLTGFSLFNGWQNISHIQAQIAHAKQEETLRKQDYLSQHSQQATLDVGEVGYYVFHNVYHTPDEWSFIALGNRLVTPYVQRIRLLGLQGQLYDGESHHPEYVMLGGFDYAFWLVFFAPLLCIALLHDLKASEHQAQRLLFLQSLTASPGRFWWQRVLSRWLLIALTFSLPVLAFSVMHGLSSTPLLQVLLITLLYTLLWTALCAAFSLRARALNANLNALALTSLWLVSCIVLPNLGQLWLHQHYPVQDGSQIALQHRQAVHSAWDLPKSATLTPFYALYPQWQDSAPVVDRFHWKWYYAFQHMADVKLAPQVRAREQALLQRDQATRLLGYVLPAVWVQRSLEGIAHSNVADLLAHRQRITALHTQLRHAAYPYLFEEKQFTAEAFARLPAFETVPEQLKNADAN